MEPITLSLSLILPIFLIALIFYAFKPKSSKKYNLPPGSFGWPIIGETLGFMNEAHEKWIGDRMKKYSSKIFKTRVLGENMVVLCGTAGHKFVAANEEKLFIAWRPESMQKLFRSSYQKDAKAPQSRKAETQITKAPGFIKPEALVKYAEAMDAIVDKHFKTYWEGKEVVEVHHLSQVMVLQLAGRFFLGIGDDARIEKIAKLMDKMMLALHITPINYPGSTFNQAMKATNALRDDLQLLIKEKKAAFANGAKPQDILSYLIVSADPATGQSQPDHVIADKIMGLLAAAFNSPSMTNAFLMKYLANNPKVFDKVRAEQMEIANSKKPGETLNWEDFQKMKYSWNVALEVMRIVPPLQGTFREAAADFTYEGYTIPKGWKVYWTVSTTNFDSNIFEAPEEFDPTRFEKSTPPPYTNIPFGSGPRMCPGMDYARLQTLTFIHHVVKRFKLEVVDPNFKVLGGLNPIPIEGLHIRLENISA